jgi:hypothetical protein
MIRNCNNFPFVQTSSKEHMTTFFFLNVITKHEMWVYGYDTETKQSSRWKSPQSPHPKKARLVCPQGKAVLLLLFNLRGIVHYEFTPKGQTVS